VSTRRDSCGSGGWYEEEAWQIRNPVKFLKQLLSSNIDLLDLIEKEILKLLIKKMSKTIKTKSNIYISID